MYVLLISQYIFDILVTIVAFDIFWIITLAQLSIKPQTIGTSHLYGIRIRAYIKLGTLKWTWEKSYISIWGFRALNNTAICNSKEWEEAKQWDMKQCCHLEFSLFFYESTKVEEIKMMKISLYTNFVLIFCCLSRVWYRNQYQQK